MTNLSIRYRGVCHNAPEDAYRTGKPSKKRADDAGRTAADPQTVVVASDFSIKLSLDLRKPRSYSHSRQKQFLINQLRFFTKYHLDLPRFCCRADIVPGVALQYAGDPKD
jgi:hypothetical protein